MKYFWMFFALISLDVNASQWNSVIDEAATRHGVNRYILRAIVSVETHGRPWSFNTDGEGFHFNSKAEAINSLYELNQNPWMVKIKTTAGENIRQFFPSETFALTYLENYIKNNSVEILNDSGKSVQRGQARVRKLWTFNTDIGIAQINYRYFGENKPVQQWFDPAFNLDFAASLLAMHKKVTGDDIQAAGRYHSKTKVHRERYLRELIPVYNREVSRAQDSIVIR